MLKSFQKLGYDLVTTSGCSINKLEYCNAAGAKATAEQIASGKNLVTTVKIIHTAAIAPDNTLRINSFFMFKFT